MHHIITITTNYNKKYVYMDRIIVVLKKWGPQLENPAWRIEKFRRVLISKKKTCGSKTFEKHLVICLHEKQNQTYFSYLRGIAAFIMLARLFLSRRNRFNLSRKNSWSNLDHKLVQFTVVLAANI